MSKSELIYQCTESKIKKLIEQKDMGSGKKQLAELRRGIGKAPGEMPEVWGILFENMPEILLGKMSASDAEWAIYTALTLFALHQQGQEKPMHTSENISLGAAAAGLADGEDDLERVIHRLTLVVTAVSKEDLAYHLRSVVQFLKAKEIKLNYARLAKELYLFRDPETADKIKLTWGREFYGAYYSKSTKEEFINE